MNDLNGEQALIALMRQGMDENMRPYFDFLLALAKLKDNEPQPKPTDLVHGKRIN
jgi:hypothetical protein